MSVNGYPDSLIAIDDEMVALGRPPPPVVSWISGGLKGDPNARAKAWREQLRAWEETNPETAIRWHELREAYIAEEERIDRLKFSEDEFNYQLLARQGAPQTSLDVIRRPFADKQSMRAAQEWAQDGRTWSLVLCGGKGCGKTTAAAWAAHQLSMRRFRPQWVRCVAMVDAPMWGVEAEVSKHRARTAGVLVLDDIAASVRELKPEQAMPWKAWLRDVLDARWSARRKTIVTSNMKADALAEWLGDALADRLGEGVVHTSDEDSMRRKPPPRASK